jgi:hypothetical protein
LGGTAIAGRHHANVDTRCGQLGNRRAQPEGFVVGMGRDDEQARALG